MAEASLGHAEAHGMRGASHGLACQGGAEGLEPRVAGIPVPKD